MKLSDKSLDVLKNFSGINTNIMFEEGNKIRTISPQKTIYAEAVVGDHIEGEAGIYDLTSFLAIVTTLKTPIVNFNDKLFLIQSGTLKAKFRYAASEMLKLPPKTTVQLPAVVCSFNMTWEDLDLFTKLASINQLADIAIAVTDGVLTIEAFDVSNPSANQIEDTIEGDYSKVSNFRVLLKTENLKLMPRDYKITVTELIVAFDTIDDGTPMKYWISCQHQNS